MHFLGNVFKGNFRRVCYLEGISDISRNSWVFCTSGSLSPTLLYYFNRKKNSCCNKSLLQCPLAWGQNWTSKGWSPIRSQSCWDFFSCVLHIIPLFVINQWIWQTRLRTPKLERMHLGPDFTIHMLHDLQQAKLISKCSVCPAKITGPTRDALTMNAFAMLRHVLDTE